MLNLRAEFGTELSRCASCGIRSRSICSAFTDTELIALNRIAHRRIFPAGQLIMGEGDEVVSFANIVSGIVKLTKTISDGRQHIVGLLFPSDFLGRAFRRDNPYFAEAVTPVDLCIFQRRAFEGLLQAHPSLEHKLFERTLAELDACQDWMLLLARKSAEERVASFLLMLAQRVAKSRKTREPAEVAFELPLSRAEIADCLGLTIETVSRQITRLKLRNVIHVPSSRGITVPDMKALEMAAGTPNEDAGFAFA